VLAPRAPSIRWRGTRPRPHSRVWIEDPLPVRPLHRPDPQERVLVEDVPAVGRLYPRAAYQVNQVLGGVIRFAPNELRERAVVYPFPSYSS
jgi:hypothetical protein